MHPVTHKSPDLDDVTAAFEEDARLLIERLYRLHGKRVLAICRARLRDSAEGEDAAQQVFLSAMRALIGGAVPLNTEAWLVAIARNECSARGRNPTALPLSESVIEHRRSDPCELVSHRTELAEAWHAIEELPQSQRNAFLLREIRGLGYSELADDLEVSQPTVRSLLWRARQTLRERLEQGAAALGGISWLQPVVRLLDAGSRPALPIATKAAAVGLGALAITGTAVVTPKVTSARHSHVRAAASRFPAALTGRTSTALDPGGAPARDEGLQPAKPVRSTNSIHVATKRVTRSQRTISLTRNAPASVVARTSAPSGARKSASGAISPATARTSSDDRGGAEQTSHQGSGSDDSAAAPTTAALTVPDGGQSHETTSDGGRSGSGDANDDVRNTGSSSPKSGKSGGGTDGPTGSTGSGNGKSDTSSTSSGGSGKSGSTTVTTEQDGNGIPASSGDDGGHASPAGSNSTTTNAGDGPTTTSGSDGGGSQSGSGTNSGDGSGGPAPTVSADGQSGKALPATPAAGDGGSGDRSGPGDGLSDNTLSTTVLGNPTQTSGSDGGSRTVSG